MSSKTTSLSYYPRSLIKSLSSCSPSTKITPPPQTTSPRCPIKMRSKQKKGNSPPLSRGPSNPRTYSLKRSLRWTYWNRWKSNRSRTREILLRIPKSTRTNNTRPSTPKSCLRLRKRSRERSKRRPYFPWTKRRRRTSKRSRGLL